MREKYDVNDPLWDNNHGILLNKRGITNEKKLILEEAEALSQAYENTLLHYSDTHIFTESNVLHLHKLFLKEIYQWAGEYRTVDISSVDIRWCHARFIHTEMKRFSNMLSSLTPFSANLTRKEILDRLAKIHGELIVIHPFRDGNGRVTRLLCDLLLMQAGYEPVQKDIFYEPKSREKYHAAIQEVWKEAKYTKLVKVLETLIPPKL